MQPIRKILKTNFFYALISFFNSATSFTLIPLYLANFTVSQYGIYALLSSFLYFIAIFITLNLGSALQTFYFDYRHNQQLLKEYFKHIFSLALLFALIFSAILIAIGPYLFRTIFNSISILFYPHGLIVILSAVCASLNQIYYVLLRNSEKLKRYGYFMFASTIANVFFQVLLVHYFQLNITGALLGVLLSNLTIFIYITVTNNFIQFNLKFDLIKGSLKYSLWLLPFLFIQWFLAKGDRILIENFIGLEQVGIYALLINISMLVSLVASSILNSIRPSLFAEFNMPTKKTLTYFNYYMLIIVIVSCAIYILVQNINYFDIARYYTKITNYIFLALVLFVIRVIVRFFNEYLSYHKKSRDLTLFSFLNFSFFIFLFLMFKDQLSLILLLQLLIATNLAILIGVIIRCYYLLIEVRNGKSS